MLMQGLSEIDLRCGCSASSELLRGDSRGGAGRLYDERTTVECAAAANDGMAYDHHIVSYSMCGLC
jgi:hypothetical protein